MKIKKQFIKSPNQRARWLITNPAMVVFVVAQHVPAEFMAYFLIDSASDEYVFPSKATLYDIKPTKIDVKKSVASSRYFFWNFLEKEREREREREVY